MAKTRLVEPVIRFVAIITAHETANHWARQRIEARWGSIVDQSAPVPFVAGGYYTPAMGPGLTKTLVAVGEPIDPAGLADWKTETNVWEHDAAKELALSPDRPLNLDPGYITQAKFVLATIKDRDHRLYLRDGIFAENTLTYVGKCWTFHRWTYPDYRTDEVFEFAMNCRKRLRTHLAQTGSFRKPNTIKPPNF